MTRFSAALVAAMALMSTAMAEVPQMINYQGRLTDSTTGLPYDGNATIVFSIWDDSSAGTALWQETHETVVISGGLFNVLLGSLNVISESVFDQSGRWLEEVVNGDTLKPRTQVVSVGYAFHARRSDTADIALSPGGGWTDDGTVVRLTSESDSVGIGTITPREKLEVFGNLRVAFKALIGPNNDNSGGSAFVAGMANNAVGSMSTISGGFENSALDSCAAVGGGFQNTAGNLMATVGGGDGNQAMGFTSTIAGGFLNTASGDCAAAGGGSNNIASGDFSHIGGGQENEAGSIYTSIDGGYQNIISANCRASVIGGGESNTVSDNANHAVIAGGSGNSCSAMHSTISGGIDNLADAWYTTIGGGWRNEALANSSTVAGGFDNTASGGDAVVCGGSYCEAAGNGSIVGAGTQNKAAGIYSAIVNGRYDTLTANAELSMCFGDSLYVDSPRRVVFFCNTISGRFGLNRDDHDGGISHPIHVGTDATNGNGAHLTEGGVWTDASSREFKHNFQQLDGGDVLKRVEELPIEAWEYKGTGERHIWPCAEDFHEQFDVGVPREDGSRDTRYLAAGDIAGVALAGVKELARQNRDLRQRIEELEVALQTLLAERGSGTASVSAVTAKR